LKQAASTLDDLSTGSFRPVLDDATADPGAVDRLVLCSGKLYYDIVGHDQRDAAPNVAVARIEQLYPFPVDALAALFARYPWVREVIWTQEEPQNMGPWRSIRHRLEEAVRASAAQSVQYVGRTWKASPSEGYPTAHHREQDRIVRAALGSPGPSD
jgi:2-oxoglutarate dehydrogenase E1 component